MLSMWGASTSVADDRLCAQQLSLCEKEIQEHESCRHVPPWDGHCGLVKVCDEDLTPLIQASHSAHAHPPTNPASVRPPPAGEPGVPAQQCPSRSASVASELGSDLRAGPDSARAADPASSRADATELARRRFFGTGVREPEALWAALEEAVQAEVRGAQGGADGGRTRSEAGDVGDARARPDNFLYAARPSPRADRGLLGARREFHSARDCLERLEVRRALQHVRRGLSLCPPRENADAMEDRIRLELLEERLQKIGHL